MALVKALQALSLVCVIGFAQADGRGFPSSLTNVIGMELVRIPAGEFLMGGVESAEALLKAFPSEKRPPEYFADEYPQHRVQITHAFWLGRFDVTVGQFRQFVSETGYVTEAEADGEGGWGYSPATRRIEGRNPRYSWRYTGYAQSDHHPVVNVSYNDAQAFLAWLSRRDGRSYRLPTEAEWEYANRAGQQMRYSNSNDSGDIPKFARALDLSRHHEFGHVQELEIDANDPTAFPIPVGNLEPNGFGLYDMNGNVWQWVSDWYSDTYYAESPQKDPPGPASGDRKVRRGGAWNSFPIWLRSSFRNWNTPNSRCANLGFRVAADL